MPFLFRPMYSKKAMPPTLPKTVFKRPAVKSASSSPAAPIENNALIAIKKQRKVRIRTINHFSQMNMIGPDYNLVTRGSLVNSQNTRVMISGEI